jgi:hypothetical protein
MDIYVLFLVHVQATGREAVAHVRLGSFKTFSCQPGEFGEFEKLLARMRRGA